jgi:putative proteasome-type protease
MGRLLPSAAVTYCLAMRLDDGLLFLSDTRTNAGIDNISTFRKLHLVHAGDDRIFVLQSAGNLATTQEVLDRIDLDLSTPGDHESLATVDRLFEAALYLGRLSQEVAQRHRPALSAVGADGTATFILGGQISGERPEIFLVYPEGNYIRASDELPFLQIGESKFGRFMLRMGVRAHVGLEPAVKIALGSMMTTARANLSVGPPYDGAIYRNGSLEIDEFRIEADSPYLVELAERWERHVLAGIEAMPDLPVELRKG